MNPFTGVVLYVLIWWLVLFAVLPFGPRPDADPDATSGWRGARPQPALGRKLIVTTLIAALLWVGAYWVISSPVLSFRAGGSLAMPGS